MESSDAYSQKIILFVWPDIIHGYISSLFIHMSTLFMDTNSHSSCKVTFSMDNVALCTLYSSN